MGPARTPLDPGVFEDLVDKRKPRTFAELAAVAHSLGHEVTRPDQISIYFDFDDLSLLGAMRNLGGFHTLANDRHFLMTITTGTIQVVEVKPEGLRMLFDSARATKVLSLGDLSGYATEGLEEIMILDINLDPVTTAPWT